MILTICPYYKTGRKCTSNDYCPSSDYDIEQNIRICSDVDSYVLDLEQQLERKEKELEQYKASKQASYEEMQRRWNKVLLENRELKQALQEIKDLVSDDDSMACDYELAYDLAKEILQILSEVK